MDARMTRVFVLCQFRIEIRQTTEPGRARQYGRWVYLPADPRRCGRGFFEAIERPVGRDRVSAA